MTGKNPIMIYGPKDDGTYVVEFRKRRAVDLDPKKRDACDSAFSGSVCPMGCAPGLNC
jgi:hypothetical protein